MTAARQGKRTCAARPRGVAVSPDGRRVYVSNSNSDSFSVIDAQDRAVLTTVPAGLDPEGLTLDKSGTTVLSPDGPWVVVSKPTTTLRTANRAAALASQRS